VRTPCAASLDIFPCQVLRFQSLYFSKGFLFLLDIFSSMHTCRYLQSVQKPYEYLPSNTLLFELDRDLFYAHLHLLNSHLEEIYKVLSDSVSLSFPCTVYPSSYSKTLRFPLSFYNFGVPS
jgi:hypothetical protein